MVSGGESGLMGAAALKEGHSNTIFTVRDIVDDAGDVIQSYEFQEHGIPMPGSGAGTGTFSPKTYQGGLSVNDDRADSGLYLMGHRHFDSDLGRFISRDPIGFRGGLNLFNGAGTNPVTFVDPTGLEWLPLELYIRDTQRQSELNSVYNCHGYATGAPVHNAGSAREDDFEVRGNVIPSSRTEPRWNTLPLNELELYYDPVSAPYQRGDTVLYGKDQNGNKSVLDDIYLAPDASGRMLPVLEAQHTAVVEKTDSKGNITECSSKPGQRPDIWKHGLRDSRVTGEYGQPLHYFRLKPGANPNRVWRP